MKTPVLAFIPLVLHLAKAYQGDMTYYTPGTLSLSHVDPPTPFSS